jgi:hypothetical protein
MARIVIRGSAAVYSNDEQVSDPVILRSLDGVVYDEERFTDYIGGPPAEDTVAAALEPGGAIQFGYVEGESLLTATTEYRARRLLTANELQLLVDYTMGQWSDGIGENWTCESAERCGYTIMCLGPWDFKDRVYPLVRVVEE